MKKKTIVDGHAAITQDGNKGFSFEFQPDNMSTQLADQSLVNGKAQLLSSGSFCFTPAKPRIRNNALLIQKAAHGRLSGTRDHAIQLTLKVFASEAIDWQKTFVCETVELLTNLMGPERMSIILCELLNKLNY